MFARHYPFFDFGSSSHTILNIIKSNVLSRSFYFVPKEGGEAYDQQCDVIIKPKHLRFQALCVIFNDKSFFVFIREKLLEDLFANVNQDN